MTVPNTSEPGPKTASTKTNNTNLGSRRQSCTSGANDCGSWEGPESGLRRRGGLIARAKITVVAPKPKTAE